MNGIVGNGGVVNESTEPSTLAALTTIQLGGPAPSISTAMSAAEVAELVGAADRAGGALVLGGGSNLVVADSGVRIPVIRIAIPGVSVDAESGIATICAGVEWDEAVAELVGDGWAGVEALSGIPGFAGATPVQNVGAYGVEISDLLVDVELYDRATGHVRRVPAADLGLGYRCSVLKGTERGVVTEVRLQLSRTTVPVRYSDLAKLLGVAVGEIAPAAAVREAVLTLRRGKGMVLDCADRDTASAGSFFTNPIVGAPQLVAVRAAAARRLGPGVRMPEYPVRDGFSGNRLPDSVGSTPTCGDADVSAKWQPLFGTSHAPGSVKLSAAWLIEQAGFPKGYPLAQRPDAGIAVSTKHTLALTNRGRGTTAELIALAREIRAGVLGAFGVELKPEPVLVGCSLD
ncbi:MAG: UDP-N-acetylmuramate dehydrogenase [Nakamurella sp.]